MGKSTASGEHDLTRRVTGVLGGMLKTHPLQRNEIERRSGLGKGGLSRSVRQHSIGLRSLGKILRAMRVDDLEFFARVVAADPLASLGKGPIEKRFRRALRRSFRNEGGTAVAARPQELWLLLDALPGAYLAENFRTDPRWRSAAAVEVACEHLTLLRFRDPGASAELAHQLMAGVADSRCLDGLTQVGIAWLDALRLGGRVQEAFTVGRAVVGPGVGGRATERFLTAGRLLLLTGDLDTALELFELALKLAGDRPIAGLKAEIALLQCHIQLGTLDDRRLSRCLARVRGAGWLLELTLHQSAADWLARRGRLAGARDHLAEARRQLPDVPVPYLTGWLLWTESLIARRAGDLESAAEQLAQTTELFSAVNLFDTALAGLDLLDLHLLRGHSEAASAVARQLTGLLMASETNLIGEAALVELHRLAGSACEAGAVERTRQLLLRSRRLGLRG